MGGKGVLGSSDTGFCGFDEMKELKRDGDWERDQKCENQFSLVFLYSVRSLFSRRFVDQFDSICFLFFSMLNLFDLMIWNALGFECFEGSERNRRFERKEKTKVFGWNWIIHIPGRLGEIYPQEEDPIMGEIEPCPERNTLFPSMFLRGVFKDRSLGGFKC